MNWVLFQQSEIFFKKFYQQCFLSLIFRFRSFAKRLVSNDFAEIWKPIIVPELNYYYSRYEISNLGRIKNRKTGKILKPNYTSCEYPRIRLTHDSSKEITVCIHRLVCSVLRGPPKGNKTEVHHKNHIKSDFRLANLEWVDRSENQRLCYEKHGSKRSGLPVVKLNEKREVVERFSSVMNASKHEGISSTAMSKRIKTGKIYKQHLWEVETLEDLEGEIWKISTQDKNLLVSNLGRFKCLKRGSLIQTFPRNSYLVLNKRYDRLIKLVSHRVVATAFCPNPENKPFVDHIDGKKANNKASNLRWVTQSENQANPNTTTNRAVFQICIQTKKILKRFSTITKAAKYVGANKGEISEACSGKRKTSRKFIWKYADR